MPYKEKFTPDASGRKAVVLFAPRIGRDGRIDDRRQEADPIQAALDALAKIGDFRIKGAVWVLTCNNQQTIALQGHLTTLKDVLEVIAGPLATPVAETIKMSNGYIQFMNELGGNNGVEIQGVVGLPGLMVTPRMGKLGDEFLNAARLAVTGRVLTEFLANAAAKSPVLATTFQLGGIASVIQTILSGTPLGWALAAAVGIIPDLLLPEPDPNEHGAVHANRDAVGAWEAFTFGDLGDGRISVLSWLGHLSAEGGGGAGVYANRPQVLEWETWTQLPNGDGTVSFRTHNGHFLCAEMGGGRECQADRRKIGEWEKFRVEPQPNGLWAIRASNGQFVSVQP